MGEYTESFEYKNYTSKERYRVLLNLISEHPNFYIFAEDTLIKLIENNVFNQDDVEFVGKIKFNLANHKYNPNNEKLREQIKLRNAEK